jgi:hypothetical protein
MPCATRPAGSCARLSALNLAVTFERDQRDRRYPERLAGSFLASLIIHALLAALLFTVLVSSSQQGATESVQGGEVITVSRTSPIAVANQPAAVHAVAPVPHVRVVAPLQHAPLAELQSQRLPVNRHELAKIVPSAPPNPRPLPQQTPQPNPQPTQNIFETQPRNELPAAPVNVPTVAPVAVTLKPPPTIAPSPVPTAAPSAHPSPKAVPLVRATARAATPAPALPHPSPTAAAIARASPAPSAAPAIRASAQPAQHAGVPSPSPTNAAAVARTAGKAPSPGPSSGASPGPKSGAGPKAQAAPPRPIAVPPTPRPGPRVTAAPKTRNAPNINAKLRSLLPNNPVHPTSKSYSPTYSLRGRLEPTPPPDVLARTKYIYEVKNTGNEARVKMWVTAARKEGPTTICTGWLVRYPQVIRGGYADAAGPDSSIVHSDLHGGPTNGTQIAIGGGSGDHEPLSPFAAGLAPIVDGIVSQPCDGRLLVPFAPSPVSSP